MTVVAPRVEIVVAEAIPDVLIAGMPRNPS
jgi:hypothetical protein